MKFPFHNSQVVPITTNISQQKSFHLINFLNFPQLNNFTTFPSFSVITKENSSKALLVKLVSNQENENCEENIVCVLAPIKIMDTSELLLHVV